jgi:serine/threonine protein kinase
MNRGLTARGEAGGTVSLMAPEQLLDFAFANPSADLYAAAATLFRLLTGTDAIVVAGDVADASIATVAAAVLATPRRPLHALCAELPTPLCRYLDALLARDPTFRAGLRAGEVADVLEEWTARGT